VKVAPFQITPEEEAGLDRLLTDWQQMSSKVKTFKSRFVRFDYDGVFGDGKTPKRQVDGVLKYAAPDKGYYELSDGSEKWICTGKAIFEFRGVQKQVLEYPLPPELQGQAIADGPMPFVFGVEAAKMKARYWMRILPTPAPPPEAGAPPPQVWLEAYPKHAKDAANFQKIDVILTFEIKDNVLTRLEPYAINQVLPNGKDRTAYRFLDLEVNTMLNNLNDFFNIFVRPSTPIGWQHHVIDDNAPTGPETQPQPPANVGSAPAGVLPR
jgi:TIGR03009 family protein